jgi:hypothetical protein
VTLGSEEQFLIRTEGGPYPGTRVSDGPWPLPDELTAPTGRYVKVSESQLKEGSPHLLRGAQYRWVPDSIEALVDDAMEDVSGDQG